MSPLRPRFVVGAGVAQKTIQKVVFGAGSDFSKIKQKNYFLKPAALKKVFGCFCENPAALQEVFEKYEFKILDKSAKKYTFMNAEEFPFVSQNTFLWNLNTFLILFGIVFEISFGLCCEWKHSL